MHHVVATRTCSVCGTDEQRQGGCHGTMLAMVLLYDAGGHGVPAVQPSGNVVVEDAKVVQHQHQSAICHIMHKPDCKGIG
jgi:hypothetical protein